MFSKIKINNLLTYVFMRRRNYSSLYGNVVNLKNRGMFQDVFPSTSMHDIEQLLTKSTQTIYAGFDPTADSLHLGNLLVIVGLIHFQRCGHQPIALVGGATGKIGDPSGRSEERNQQENSVIDANLIRITKQIEKIFNNHENFIWKKQSGNIPKILPVRVINNNNWYSDMKLIEFIGNIARHFRLGTLLSRSFVQNRLQNDGISFTEFSYQIFQAYDWYHLFKNENCSFQIGGSDQMGNLMSGQELISRIENKIVYGVTLPIISNEEGDKFGKSAGNALWLDELKTTPFSVYQYLIRTEDLKVKKLLQLLTFLSNDEIDDIMEKHCKNPEQRIAQYNLAKEVTLLIHGESELQKVETVSNALYKDNAINLTSLSLADITSCLPSSVVCDLIQIPNISVLELAMKVKCFPTKGDAVRIIKAGGFYINHKRTQNSDEILNVSNHILENGLTILRVGKKNFYIVNWLR